MAAARGRPNLDPPLGRLVGPWNLSCSARPNATQILSVAAEAPPGTSSHTRGAAWTRSPPRRRPRRWPQVALRSRTLGSAQPVAPAATMINERLLWRWVIRTCRQWTFTLPAVVSRMPLRRCRTPRECWSARDCASTLLDGVATPSRPANPVCACVPADAPLAAPTRVRALRPRLGRDDC